MKGSIVSRRVKDRKTGKPYEQLYLVYDAGHKWSEKKGGWVRNQVWEKAVPNTKRHARKLLNERLARVQREEYVQTRKIPFAQLADAWLVKEITPRVKSQTVENYERQVRNHLLPAFGALEVGNITPEDIQGFMAQKIADGVAVTSVRAYVARLKGIFSKGVEWGYLRRSPTDITLRYPKENRKKLDPLSPSEVRVLLKHTPQRWYALISMAIWTGMRMGELQAAKWDNLDWSGQQYHVRETLTRAQSFSTPKTQGSIAPVFVSPWLLEVLQEHRRRQAEYQLSRGAQFVDQDLMFTTAKGSPIHHHQLRCDTFKRILREAGLRDVRFHDLRHTCATLMIANNENIKFIQRQMRHTSIQTTMDVYGHLLPEAHKDPTQRIDNLIWGPTGEVQASV